VATVDRWKNIKENYITNARVVGGVLSFKRYDQSVLTFDPTEMQPSTNPVQASRVSGNIVLAVSAIWADVDPGGTAAARPLDIVLPEMEVGDGFDFRPFFSVGASAGGLLCNLAVIKDGDVERLCFDETYGLFPWAVGGEASKDINVRTPRLTVLEGDLEDGSLRLRLKYIQATATRDVNAVSLIPFWVEGRGPFR